MSNIDFGGFFADMERVIPGLRRDEVVMIPQGWENTVIIARDSTVFRFPKLQENGRILRIEKKTTDTLRDYLSVELPAMKIRKSLSADKCLFAYYPKIRGIHLFKGDLTPSNVPAVSSGFIRFLDEMKNVPGSVTGRIRVINVDSKRLKSNYGRMLADFWTLSQDVVDKSLLDRLRGRFNEFKKLPMDGYSPRLAHYDISNENVLFSGYEGNVCGIIDWSDSGIGDFAIDLAGIRYYFGESVYSEVTGRIPEYDRSVEMRVRFYCSIVGMYRVEYGIRYRQESYLEQGLSELSAGLDNSEFDLS